MTDSLALPDAVERLMQSCLGPAAETTPALRQAVSDRAASLSGAERPAGDVPDDLKDYVDTIARHAFKITDEDVEALTGAGYREDELFELTLCAALGASVARFERGLAALREATD